MTVDTNTEGFLNNFADEFTKALLNRIQKNFKEVSLKPSSNSTVQTNNSIQKDQDPQWRTIAKLEQQNIFLSEIKNILNKLIERAFDLRTNTQPDKKFPTVVSSLEKLLKSKFGDSNTSDKKPTIVSKSTNDSTTQKQIPEEQVSKLEKANFIQPVSIEEISQDSLEKLGTKLTDILPESIKKGISKLVTSIEEMSKNLSETIQDNSYQPGLLDMLGFGGGRSRGGGRVRGRGRVRGGLGRPVVKGGLPRGVGGALKGAGILSLIAAPVLGAMEYSERLDEDQTRTQAAVGAASSTGGGILGGLGGVAAGAALGQMLIPIPGVGAVIGGIAGGIGGGMLGSMAGGSLADMITGVGKKQASRQSQHIISPTESEQRTRLIQYITSLGKYKSISEFLDAVSNEKETPIKWNAEKKIWEPYFQDTKNKTTPSVPPVTEKSIQKAVEDTKNKTEPPTINIVKPNPNKNKPQQKDWSKMTIEEQNKAVDEEFPLDVGPDLSKLAEKAAEAINKGRQSQSVQDGVIEKGQLKRSAPLGQLFEFSPKDSGIIAPQSTFDKLFEKFEKASGSQGIDNKALKDTANEAKITNNKLDQLAGGFQAMAQALSKLGINLSEQSPTIINNVSNTSSSSKQGQSAGIAQYLSNMNDAARMYTGTNGFAVQSKPYAF